MSYKNKTISKFKRLQYDDVNEISTTVLRPDKGESTVMKKGFHSCVCVSTVCNAFRSFLLRALLGTHIKGTVGCRFD